MVHSITDIAGIDLIRGIGSTKLVSHHLHYIHAAGREAHRDHDIRLADILCRGVMTDVADSTGQIQLLIHSGVGVDAALQHKGVVAVLVEELGHRVAFHHVVAMGAAAAGNDNDIALYLALIPQHIWVQEGTEALVIVAIFPVGGQRRLHGHLVAPDLPNSALGILDLTQRLAGIGQGNTHLVVGGVDTGRRCTVHLLVLSTGQLVEQHIELVKIAPESSRIKGYLAGEAEFLCHHGLHLGIGVHTSVLGKGCGRHASHCAHGHGRSGGKLHKVSSVHHHFSF